jgi:membrane associated rhomboid family serine protease
MGGLIHLTDWVQGNGQGYALTAEGTRVLQSPRELARLRAGELPTEPSVIEQPLTFEDNRRMTTWDRGEAIRNALLTPRPPVISMAIIFINVAWFLAGIVVAERQQVPLNQYLYGGANKVLEQMGALAVPDIARGEWWRLLTCCFVHIGMFHLAVNMYSLYAVGPFFEQIWGRGRFLVLYLIAGFGGSCSMAIFQDPRAVGAGASGALWGILAAYAVWIVLNRRHLPGPLVRSWLRQIVIVFAINIFITYSIPNISAAAHYGGGAVGAVAGALLNFQRFGSIWQRRLALVGLLALPLLCVGALVKPDVIAHWIPSPRLFPQAEKLDLQARCLPAAHHAEKEANAIVASTVAPLQKREPSDWSIDEFHQAVKGLAEARARLNVGLEVLRERGAYHDSAAEEGRLKLLSILEREGEDYEALEFGKIYIPYLAQMEREAFYGDNAKTLRDILLFDPPARFAEEVQSTAAVLDKQQVDFAQVAELLKKSGPYHKDLLEKQRQLTAELAETEGEVLRSNAQRLRQGNAWTRDDQIRLVRQKDRVKELTRQWSQLLISKPEPHPPGPKDPGRFIPRSSETRTL